MDRAFHNIEPVFNNESKILILGSFPSVKSREGKFFYNHPQNRFWKVIATLCGDDVPVTIKQKENMLLKNKIALWDVIASCEICGSSDSSIKNVVPNDLSTVLNAAKISAVFCNGATAYKFYKKYTEKNVSVPVKKLPSTSPANAAYTLERLCREWKIILDYIST